MSLTSEDVSLYVCPVCRCKVDFAADKSGLECPECGRLYPIIDDIPQMMVEEASGNGPQGRRA